MKKIWLCLLSVLLLSCSADIKYISSKRIPVDENIAEEASNHVTEGDEIGDGHIVYAIANEELLESENVVYPVYQNDELMSFLLCKGEDKEVINDSDICRHYQDDDAFIFVLKEDRLYYCSNTVICPSAETDDEIKDILSSYEIKENEEVTEKRIKLKRPDIAIIDGTEYAAGRIVVVFEDGDIDEMKKEYAEFIEGEYRSRIKSLKAYVFTFENRSASGLKKLLENTLELDYVKDAWLEKVAHPNSGGNGNSVQ